MSSESSNVPESVDDSESASASLVPAGESALTAPFPALPIERVFALNGSGPPAIGLAALTFEGEPLDWEKFVGIIEDIVAEHPKMGARLVRKPGVLRSEMIWEPLPNAAREACTAFDPDPTLDDLAVFEERAHQLINERMDISREPGIRFWYMPHCGDRYSIIFKAHHSVFDGHGALLFAIEVCARYNGFDSLGLSGDPTVPPPPLVPGGFWEKLKLVAGLLAFRARRAWQTRFASPATLFDARKKPDGGVAGVIHIVPEERSDTYFAAAKAHGVTFNDFYLAAVARVLPGWMRERGLEPGTARFAVNQDLRKLGNLDRIAEIRSSAFHVWSAGPPAIDGRDLLLDIHQQTKECQELRIAEAISLLGFILRLPEWLVRGLVVSPASKPKLCDSMIVSNMGRLPESDPKKGGILRLGQAQLTRNMPYGRSADGIGILSMPFTLGGELNLSISYLTGLLTREEVERLAELTETSLDELAALAPPSSD